jgi:hypothetical protein
MRNDEKRIKAWFAAVFVIAMGLPIDTFAQLDAKEVLVLPAFRRFGHMRGRLMTAT